MASLPVLVFGAGGHGRVVAEVVQSAGLVVEGFVDDNELIEKQALGLPVLGTGAWLARQPPRVVALGIGGNRARERVAAALTEQGHTLLTAVHARAWVSPTARLGAGTVVMAMSVVNAEVRVGAGVILNTASVVEHECVIGDFTHVSPSATLGGGARVGARTHIGIGATLLHLATVGDDCTIGGGAVVLKQIESGVTAVGVPARRLR
ncbi:MAG: acetyltransferase [Myxococcales bacterium]|nr:acetyltransferase [Myxococcales bacterium]